MRQRSHKGAKHVRGARHTTRLQLHRLTRVGPRYGRDPHRRHRRRDVLCAGLPRPRRARRRSVSPSLQVYAVSVTDHGIVTRAFRPDAQAAARGAGHAATFATTEHFNLQVSRAITVSEANGRASIYLAALRGTLAAPLHEAPGAWQLTLTAAGMVAVVNSVVVAACAGLILVAAGVDSLPIPVTAGAFVGAAAFALQHRHHRRARDSYSPEAVDRAAILIPPPQPAAPA